MPLSPPVPRRELAHTRRIELTGYSRDDGLFDIEARLTDTKSEGFSTDDREWVHPGEPLHGMSMRMTVDEEMVIVGFEAATDYSPYRICPEIAPNYSSLVGLTIGRGFLRAAAERVGGVHGCTHLRELLQPMATVAFQTLYPVLARRKSSSSAGKPALLNTCYAYRDDGPVVERKWPDQFVGGAVAL
ncbi:DUF2889 domain-containing protein [Acidisphaera sp. L21]|uniref:DUF2889 domain-containing protein n=1 Tax=Acidisphaera sp. L21 TaxID=1641851 RepID=UPI00131C29F7|nr:DUF2889 domain-containing protein [Acidisphaera sp. L21]